MQFLYFVFILTSLSKVCTWAVIKKNKLIHYRQKKTNLFTDLSWLCHYRVLGKNISKKIQDHIVMFCNWNNYTEILNKQTLYLPPIRHPGGRLPLLWNEAFTHAGNSPGALYLYIWFLSFIQCHLGLEGLTVGLLDVSIYEAFEATCCRVFTEISRACAAVCVSYPQIT